MDPDGLVNMVGAFVGLIGAVGPIIQTSRKEKSNIQPKPRTVLEQINKQGKFRHASVQFPHQLGNL